ncbi:MAG TPA: SDR family NAD(P)-dependent oxidoreductase [Herpetosiphonaceae bacterium]
MNPSGNTVLITGGAGGIGLALARRFHREGNAVILTGRDRARLERAAAELPGAIAEQADMRDEAALARLAGAYPEVNVLVNNAAIQHIYQWADPASPAALIDEELAVNLRGPLLLTKHFLPGLLARPQAAIINVSSGLGLAPKQSAPVYCATKAALHAFSKALRWQLEPAGVKVFEIIPPLVDTPMTAGRGKDKLAPDQLADQFWRGFVRDEYELPIGKTRLLMTVQRLAPGLADRIMRRS